MEEVLPSIRKTGGYVANDDMFINTYLPFADDNTKLLFKQTLYTVRVQNEKINKLEEENAQKSQIITEYEPKVSYYDLVLQSKDAMNITLIAKDYGMSAKAMNILLHKLEIQYKQGDTWLLYNEYSDKGYTKSKTTTYEKPNGETGTKMSTKWTQKGRLFLYQELKNRKNIIPVIEREDNN